MSEQQAKYDAKRAEATIRALTLERQQMAESVEEAVSALEAATAAHGDEASALRASLATETNRADRMYAERNLCVSALTRNMDDAVIGWRTGEGIAPEWRHVVYVNLPTGQVSFHIHESELPLFAHLVRTDDPVWDGHSVSDKTERLKAFGTAGIQAADLLTTRFQAIEEAAQKVLEKISHGKVDPHE